MTQVRNPFKYGAPVEGEYYFPLPGFSRLVRSYLDNRINVVLYGPRRFGKTSFILDLIREEEQQDKTCLLIDVFNITSHRDFLQQILRALQSKQTWTKKLANKLSHFRLIPTATPDETGQISYSIHPDFTSEKDVKDLIHDTFAAFGKLDERVVIAIDEFQKITQLEDGGWLEATVRTQMQQLKNVVFLFSGSRKSVLYDMLNSQNSPFYKTCQPLDIPILGDDFTDWIIGRFKSVNITCERRAIVELRRLVHDTPNYIQMVCFHLVAAEAVTRVDSGKIDHTLHTIVKQNAYAFETLLNSLTPLQHRVLRLCANEPAAIFSRDLIKKYEVTSGPALATSIKSLKQKGILDTASKRGQVIFDDPLFKIWLQKEFS